MAVHLTHLRTQGFKSFADPAELAVLPGLTGIVGPNGCGKSNVADALRWAMGEGHARTLRGAEMDDLIFADTAARPGHNRAEVALTLAGGGFPAPFAGLSEVQVVRQLRRGAGSAYRANGQEMRARDVQALFADLASGARSSAMVSQGRVGALVAARPDERRLVLEEAAGIGGLHARQAEAEAEARLRAAAANQAHGAAKCGLARSGDIILSDQLTTARRQTACVAGRSVIRCRRTLQQEPRPTWPLNHQRQRPRQKRQQSHRSKPPPQRLSPNLQESARHPRRGARLRLWPKRQ